MVIFIILILAIYYFSRLALKEIFFLLMRLFNNRSFVLSVVTLVMLPGTIVHELSHFIVALVLMLPVKSMSLFPVFEESELKLGEVRFEKRDVLRSALVGVAPLFFGVLFIFGVFYFHVYPTGDYLLNALISYILFSVSTNMFSSNQDLKEAIFIIPFTLMAGLLFYVLDIKLDTGLINAIIKEANYNLFIVLAINVTLFLAIRLLNSLRK